MTTDRPGPVLVIGASRGLGAAAASAMATSGCRVVAMARSASPLAAFADTSPDITPVVGDGRDTDLAVELLDTHRPTGVLIGGGVTPLMAPLEQHTWETLSIHWDHDVAIVYNWLHSILNHPDDDLRHVVVISSGAGLFGSPGSGGYAGAKATTRLLTASAADSARRLGRTTTFTSVNPKLTSATDLGAAAIAGYAEIDGRSRGDALAQPALFTLDHAGTCLAGLVTRPDTYTDGHYVLGEHGLSAA